MTQVENNPIGEAITRLRQQAKLSEYALGRAAGFNATLVFYIASGQRVPKIDTVRGLASVLAEKLDRKVEAVFLEICGFDPKLIERPAAPEKPQTLAESLTDNEEKALLETQAKIQGLKVYTWYENGQTHALACANPAAFFRLTGKTSQRFFYDKVKNNDPTAKIMRVALASPNEVITL